MIRHIWTEEEKKYLKRITPGHHYNEILVMMNKKFNLDLEMGQIKGAIARYNLNTGFDGRFKPKTIPFNKGLKGICPKGCEKSWFEKGHRPQNYKPVGSERLNVDGYTEIKIKDPKLWRLKHIHIWEQHNKKPLPKSHAIIFADGDKTNFNIDNLILVSRRQLLILNRKRLLKNDADLTKVAVNIAKVQEKIDERRAEIGSRAKCKNNSNK